MLPWFHFRGVLLVERNIFLIFFHAKCEKGIEKKMRKKFSVKDIKKKVSRKKKMWKELKKKK